MRIVRWVGNDQQRFDQLVEYFLQDEPLVMQRAAWPLGYAVIAHPRLLKKHFSKIVKNLQRPGLHDAVKRNTVRLLQEIDIPEKFHAEVMNRCFDYVSSPAEKPAIKAFSLTILHKLSVRYPEIKQEMKAIISLQWQNESKAFRHRAGKILNGSAGKNRHRSGS